MKIETHKRVATLKLHGVGKMGTRQRKRVIKWLRQCAKDIETDGWNYAPRFRATFNWRK